MKESLWQRFKKWCTVDHIVDTVVDAFLLIFDVITSPILIVMRLLRRFIVNWLVGGIKNTIKRIVFWFARKREYRLKHGHGIFRTYWWLICASPLIAFVLVCVLMFSYLWVTDPEPIDWSWDSDDTTETN